MAPPETKILEIAASYVGWPYQMPPQEGVSFDCSSYALTVYEDAGLPFPGGVRTAEQERQACQALAWGEQVPGDLIFFEGTYIPSDPPGPDGHTASHVGILIDHESMWSAQEPAVKVVNYLTDYWSPKILSVGRYR